MMVDTDGGQTENPALGTGIGRVYAVSGRSRNSGRAGLLYDKTIPYRQLWNRRIGGSENVKCCHYFAIALAIFLGYKTKINTGLFSVLYLRILSDAL